MLRIGIIGCGLAARVHAPRLTATREVRIVACADPDLGAARSFAEFATAKDSVEQEPIAAFDDHKALLARVNPDALAIFTPHLAHYRPAMDALQAGCHVFIEKPLSTNPQEADDIVGLARGRGRKVGVGHQYRLAPSLVEARRRLLDGAIGPVRLIQATMAAPWLSTHAGAEDSWRFDPKTSGGGILFDVGDHLVNTLLWTCGQTAIEVLALQERLASGADVVTAAALKLSNGALATLAITGVSLRQLFALSYFGERGRLRATADALTQEWDDGREEIVDFPAPEKRSTAISSPPSSPTHRSVAPRTKPWKPYDSLTPSAVPPPRDKECDWPNPSKCERLPHASLDNRFFREYAHDFESSSPEPIRPSRGSLRATAKSLTLVP